MFFESTDSSTGRDGRRALLDLIKGCVSPGTAPFAAALAAGDDVKTEAALKAILDKIQVLEHLIRGGCGAAAELDMSTYGFSVPAESGAGYGTLAARLDDLVSATSVSFDDASFERGVDVNLPPAAAAVAVGVQCEADLDGLAYGYEGSTGDFSAVGCGAVRATDDMPPRCGMRCGCFSFHGFCRVGFVIGYGDASAWW
ncbi:hypothetical protein CYMTET_46157 [Cymbomonas tetramitiformis]|uniref:Uncharacterized protein n=1 Tax=Cymbomonas tetramitiformis TaxID=36881 RepID=A0AAE0EXK7_9CHLO|nr:hypothetical protein CYMTET_46157 [Cymbomonas tetramitiformis]